ncbi:MAG: PA domain-containing protein, partial [Acidimicrobiia bacterium]
MVRPPLGNRRRSILIALASASLLLLLTSAPAVGSHSAEPGEVELFNLEHVFNFNPEDHDPGRDPFVGSDLEFFTHTVPLRDYETGELIDEEGNTLPARGKPVMAERDFAVMGSYQRGGYVFDITDPENPQFVTQVTCRQERNDVAIRKFTDPATGETRVMLALTQQAGIPCSDEDAGVGVRVDSPDDLAGFFAATQWSGTAPVAEQAAELVYAGTGCTDVQYAGVDVEGKIALVDKRENVDGIRDCPTFSFKQKMDAAERAGAIGLVQVDEDDIRSGGNAIDSGIPGLEIILSDGAPIRDAVALEERTVEVTLTVTSDPSFPTIGAGSGGIGVFDITDPLEWKPMYRLVTGQGGVHNFVFHPTKPFGYASNGALPGLINTLPIVDFTDPDNPVLIEGPQTEGGVHDTEFSLDGTRAYAASENNYRIYDTTDPANPVLISRTPNVGSYAHG